MNWNSNFVAAKESKCDEILNLEIMFTLLLIQNTLWFTECLLGTPEDGFVYTAVHQWTLLYRPAEPVPKNVQLCKKSVFNCPAKVKKIVRQLLKLKGKMNFSDQALKHSWKVSVVTPKTSHP